MKTIIQHTRGNRIELLFPLSKMKITSTDGNVTREETSLTPFGNVIVRLYRGGIACYDFTPVVKENVLSVVDNGAILSGKYSIEILSHDSQNRPMRYKTIALLEVNETTAQGGTYDTNEFNVIAYYPFIRGRESAILIDEDEVSIIEGGRFGGDEDDTDDFADVSAIFGEGSVEVDDQYVTLNI